MGVMDAELEARWRRFAAEVVSAVAGVGGGPPELLILPTAMVVAGQGEQVRQLGAAIVELVSRRAQLLVLSSTASPTPARESLATTIAALVVAGVEVGPELARLCAAWRRAPRPAAREPRPRRRVAAIAVRGPAARSVDLPGEPAGDADASPAPLPAPGGEDRNADALAGQASVGQVVAPPRRSRATDDALLARLRAHPRGTTVPKSFAILLWRRFGSLPAAYAAAGVAPPERRVTSDVLLARLRACDRQQPVPRALASALRDRFGSQAAAFAAAGLERVPRGRGAASLLAELRAPPDETRLPAALASALVRRFGSVSAARIAAGVEGPPPELLPSPALLARLRAHDAIGTIPPALATELERRFGSLAAARGVAARPARARKRTRAG